MNVGRSCEGRSGQTVKNYEFHLRARRYARMGSVWLALVCLAALALWDPVARHVRAAKLLLSFQDAEAPDVFVEELELAGLPRVMFGRPGRTPVLLLHGVHPAGYREPRFRQFAAQLATRGYSVSAVHLEGLADLRFDPSTVDRVVAAAEALARETGQPSVGVVGISIGGGVAIRACTQTLAIRAIWAIGAHHDVRALLDGWIASSEERYGPQALAHAWPAEYFEAADAQAAADAIVARLTHAPEPALSDTAREELAWLTAEPMPDEAQRRLRAIVARHGDELGALSPADALAEVSAPVFLLHGEHDPLIPASESEAIDRGLPESSRGGVVRTPLLRHADGASDPGPYEQWRVVHLVAGALAAL